MERWNKMNIIEVKGDLFSAPKDNVLMHCISSDFALGAGIAKKFTSLGVKAELCRQYPNAWSGSGYALKTNATEWPAEINLVTKEKYFYKPTITTLRQALESYKNTYGHLYSKIAMPKIGCGLDKLNWTDVKNVLTEIFKDTNVEITVYSLN